MADERSKIFISYSRADAVFVDDLAAGLEADDAFEVLIDRHGIGHGEDWRARLGGLILECDSMVFVMSPDSLSSEICAWEVAEALRLGRRIIPALWRDVDFAAAPKELSALNAVPFTEGQVIRGLAKLTAALKTDLGWLRALTTLSERAEEWARRGRPEELLLRGAPLAEAQGLIAGKPISAPEIPALLAEYLTAGDVEETRLIEAQAAQIAELERANKLANSARRRIRAWLVVAVIALIGALGAGAAALFSREQAVAAQAVAETAQARAERDFATAERALNGLIFNIAQDLKRVEGVSPGAIRRILGQAEDTAAALLAGDPENDKLRRSKAAALIEFSEVYLRTGDVAAAETALTEALAMFRALAAKNAVKNGAQSEDALRPRRDLAVALNKIGELRARQGDLDAAGKAYRESLDLSRASAAAAPEKALYRRDVSVSLDHLGDLRLAQGDPAAARAAYEEALGLRRALVAAAPEEIEPRRDLSVSLNKLADLWSGQGEAEAARAAYAEGLEIARALAKEAPESVAYQRDLSVSLDRMGDLAVERGDLAAARAFYAEGLALRRALAEAAPEDLAAEADLAISLTKLGHTSEGGAKIALLEEALRRVRALAAAGALPAERASWPAMLEQGLALARAQAALLQATELAQSAARAFAAQDYARADKDMRAALAAFDGAGPAPEGLEETARAFEISLLAGVSAYALYVGEGVAAEAAARRLLAREPENLYAAANLAFARTLQGDPARAKAIFLRHVGETVPDGRAWTPAVAETLESLRAAGLALPEMDAILAEMAAAGEQK